jgi:hypothetical protein
MKKLLGWVFAVVLGCWAELKAILDWIGRGLAVRDVPEFLERILNYLLATPQWMPAVLAALLVCFLVYDTAAMRSLIRRWSGAVPTASPRNSSALSQDRLPTPNVRIDELLRRITGMHEFPGPNEQGSKTVVDVCERLREMALHQTLAVFGGINWRTTPPADYDRMVRDRIPPDYWKNHRIDVIDFLGPDEKRGRTISLTGTVDPSDYYGIWFDRREVDSHWPPT